MTADRVTAQVVACCGPLLLGTCASVAARENSSIAIRPGFAVTFALSEVGPRRLQPVRIRRSPIGPAEPQRGEITVGLAPAGGAVGMAKLHVFERTSRPVTLSVVAFGGSKQLATESVCGHLDSDSWLALPAETTTVVVNRFAEGECK